MNGRTEASTRGYPRDPAGPAGARPALEREGQRSAAGTWPLLSGLGPLGALPTAPRLGRAFAVLVLGGWGLGGMTEAAELIVSEMASNVVRAATNPDGSLVYDAHGRLPVLWLRLLSDLRQTRIEVWDNLPADRGVPAARRPAPEEESGRGLELVAAISQRWGWEPVPGRQAKCVWALLTVQ